MIYLHCGIHKTASTLIQQTLELNTHKLPFHYNQQYGYLGALLCARSPLPRNDLRRLRRNWVHKDALVSCEGFMGNYVEAYNNTQAIAKDLAYIFKDHEVKIIAFLRDQDTFIESVYVQMVKGGYLKSFDEFIIEYNWRSLNWLDKLNIYNKLFKSVKALPYDNPANDYVNMLLDVVKPGLSIEYEKNLLVNASLNKKGVDLALMNNRYLDKRVQWEYVHFLEKFFVKQPGEAFNFFNEGQREIVKEHFKESNEEVWRLYG